MVLVLPKKTRLSDFGLELATVKVLCTFPTGTATLPFLVRFLTEFGENRTRTGAESITGRPGEENGTMRRTAPPAPALSVRIFP